MTTERANASAQAGGQLVLGAGAAEAACISGRFHAVLHRARPEHVSEYLRLHSHVQNLRNRAATRQRLMARVRNGSNDGLSQHLLAQADAAAEHMRTLMEVQAELDAPNLVTTVGKNYLLDNGLAGSAYTAAFYLGLISLTSYTAVAAADTMSSHAGWLEAGVANAPTYSEATRRTAAWSAASAGSKALSAGLVFTFTGSGTVKGCFLNTVSTKDGTTGTLYSAGLFSGSDQPVVNTSTLTVSYTASL